MRKYDVIPSTLVEISLLAEFSTFAQIFCQKFRQKSKFFVEILAEKFAPFLAQIFGDGKSQIILWNFSKNWLLCRNFAKEFDFCQNFAKNIRLLLKFCKKNSVNFDFYRNFGQKFLAKIFPPKFRQKSKILPIAKFRPK